MKHIHNHEKEQFENLFRDIDNFEDRVKILEIFLQTENHVTDKDMLQLLEKNGHHFDAGFVRDTLKLMCRFGFARKDRFDNGVVRYEHLHLGHHHDHMICTRCRKIIEFKDDKLEDMQIQIAASYGFHMLQHRMEIYGICADCMKERDRIIPLVSAKQGEKVIIRDMTGGSTARMRLLSMGIRIGDNIEIITNNGKGQMVVSADYNRYAIGRGMAQKIWVQPVPPPSPQRGE